MVVINKYLVLAIQYDYPFTMVKYCVQQLLGSLQDSSLGKFLAFKLQRRSKKFLPMVQVLEYHYLINNVLFYPVFVRSNSIFW
jgi:hypothetical protein